MPGASTEGTVTFAFNAPIGTPPTSLPQTQNQKKCLSGLCTPSARPPTTLVRSGSPGSRGNTSAVPTGGLGIYVQPPGSVAAPSSLDPNNSLPQYRPVKGA